MNNKEQFKRIISFFTSLVLIVGFTSIFGYVWYHSYNPAIYEEFYRKGNWVLIGIYTIIMALFMKLYDYYKVWYLKPKDALYSQIISIMCTNVIVCLLIKLIDRYLTGARWIAPMVIVTILDLAFATVWTLAVSRLFRKLYPPRKMIMIYDSSQNAQTLVKKMSLRDDKYMICKAISISDGIDVAIKEIDNYEAVIICDIDHSVKSILLKYCFANHKRAYVTPSTSDIIMRSAHDVTLFDTPLVLCRNSGMTFEQRLMKRTFDVIVSLVAIVPLSIVMLLCAIAIKLEDGGKVLYKQVRLTQNGKEFTIYKFRSMVENAEKHGPQLAQDDDDRITKVGKVLRKYRLDEIPQLFNILKGDMSFVGPRPERPELTAKYEKTMPEFGFRLNAKAGLTGYAQVTGRYDTTPYDKLKMDLMYIENYSILLDIQIIFMTVKIVLFPVKTNSEELGE